MWGWIKRTYWERIGWRLRSFRRGLHSLFYYLPTVWKDRDWDYTYIYEILEKKLLKQSKYTRKHGCHTSSGKNANEIDECIDLIRKIRNDYYEDIEMGSYYDRRKENDNPDFLTMHRLSRLREEHSKKRLFRLMEKNIHSWWE